MSSTLPTLSLPSKLRSIGLGAGFFEEIRPGDFRAQIETNLFGSVNVTRAVLPVMRGQRSGLIVGG